MWGVSCLQTSRKIGCAAAPPNGQYVFFILQYKYSMYKDIRRAHSPHSLRKCKLYPRKAAVAFMNIAEPVAPRRHIHPLYCPVHSSRIILYCCVFSVLRDSATPVQRANKRLEWDGMVKFLIQHARSTGGEGKAAKDASCAFSAQVIATGRRLREGRTYPVMLTVPDLMSLREKHNAHLLDEIVAIQPFLAKNPFTGCGLFETEFERKGCKRTAQAALGTYELLRWPEEDVRWFDDNFDPSCNADTFNRPAARGGATFAQQRRKHGSAKRVHGVLHRMLATTTKQIVEHVEREVRFIYHTGLWIQKMSQITAILFQGLI